MKKHFLNLALWALLPMSLCVTGCSDDDTYPDVDGQTPVAEMNTLHIQTAAGRTFTIEGTLTDAGWNLNHSAAMCRLILEQNH